MKTNRILALVGTLLLFVGVFTPVVTMPFLGNVDYYHQNPPDGAFLLLVALATGGLTLTDRLRDLVWPGAAALAKIALSLLFFEKMLGTMRNFANGPMRLPNMPPVPIGNSQVSGAFHRIAEAMTSQIGLQWGWAVLAAGAALLFYVGVTARRAAGRPAPAADFDEDGPPPASLQD